MVRVLVLHLSLNSIPQSYLLPVHVGKNHVDSVHELVERHLIEVFGGHCAYILEQSLLTLAL